MKHTHGTGGSFLSRMRKDSAGNTLAMMAIALVPVTAIAGSAIDTARTYYVKVRLQQACDAGALTGRKFMNGNTFDATAQARANTMFANNFSAGMFGSSNPSFTPSQTSDGQVRGDASVTVPMTLTKMMGADPATISVSCIAKLEIPNLDVMFVLDTTGSMNEVPSGDSQSKITSLRSSVLSFYDTVQSAKQSGTQVRYGFMPYSQTVNVGTFLKREWMVDKWTYQSRIYDGSDQVTTTSNTPYTTTVARDWYGYTGTKTTTTTVVPGENCPSYTNTYTSNTTTTTTKVEQQSDGSTWTYQTQKQTQNGDAYSASKGTGVCNVTKTSYNNYIGYRDLIIKPGPGTQTTTSTRYWWMYRPVEFDVSGYKGSASNGLVTGSSTVSYPISINNGVVTNVNVPWTSSNACIEERQTVAASSYSPIPPNAYDMDIDMVPDPTRPETQWKPALARLIYSRYGVNNWSVPQYRYNGDTTNMSSVTYYTCPSTARKLDAALTRSTLNTYLNGLVVSGNTYHDIGFVWGARFISPTGIFANENAAAPNGSQISRHIIFMTDGQTDTNVNNYEAYGLPALDRRRSDPASLPTNAQQNQTVADRLSALCTATKAKNITVWVIAFGTDLTPMLSNCASPGRAYKADNSSELQTTFANIASQIAKLRMSK